MTTTYTGSSVTAPKSLFKVTYVTEVFVLAEKEESVKEKFPTIDSIELVERLDQIPDSARWAKVEGHDRWMVIEAFYETSKPKGDVKDNK